MLDVVVGHIGMSKTVNGNVMGQANLLADFSVTLTGTATDTAAKREVGRTADVLMFPADRIILLFDNSLGRFLLWTCIVQFCLSEFFCHPLIDDFRLLIELFAEHLQVYHGLLVQNNHTLAGFGFRCLRDLLAVHIDHILINQNVLLKSS